MIGTFCHRIIEEIYAAGSQMDAFDASRMAGSLFDSLLPSMASVLLLDGYAIERQRYRSSIVHAVQQLVETINRLHMKVEKTEASLEAKIDNIPFVGSADLLLRDRDGHPYILDMKWSSSSKYRRREVEEGSSLQLAAYAWMLRSAERAEQVSAGYYLLAQGELFSYSPTLTDEPIDSLYTLEDIWNRGVISMHDVIRQFDSGLIEARGVVESMSSKDEGIDQEKTRERFAALYGDRGMLYLPPPCGLCDFGRLCGLSGGTV